MDSRSGGKIIKRSRIGGAKSPYERTSENPNWVRGLIFPATRMIATGAGKLFSSVFTPYTCSSSSDDDPDSDSDSDSEDGVGGDDDGCDIPSSGVDVSKKKNGTSSEVIKCFSKESQLVGKSETKRVIEELLMHETFSREECDRLIEMISSRVVDCSSIMGGQDASLKEIPSGRVEDDLCSKALMEAKKWLEGKKVGSSSEFDRSKYSLNSSVLDHVTLEHRIVTEDEVGSPVDMAKLYMQGRPPWASPTLRHIESRTPSSMVIELFKEGSHYQLHSNSSSSVQKRDSLAAGSWNIQEEIRRVRYKATENMLRATSSTKVDLPLFPLEPKYTRDSLVSETIGGNGDKIHDSISFEAGRPTDAHVALTVEAAEPIDRGHSDLEMTRGGSQNIMLSSKQAMIVSEPKQIVEEGGAASKSHHSVNVELLLRQHTATDRRSSDDNISPGNEVSGALNANGLPISKSSLSAGLDVEENPRQCNEEDPIIQVGEEKTRIEETCEFLSEASMEIPVVNERESIPGGLQNSGSTRYEETGENVKRSSMVEKQPGKKPNRYPRKRQGKRNHTAN